MSSQDRITPYEGGDIKTRIDEIVRSDVESVFIEMMDERTAWMRIGTEVFWIKATRDGLVIKFSEDWDGPDE